MEKDKSCKTPRWRLLKSQLNNLSSEAFSEAAKAMEGNIIVDVRTAKEFSTGHIPNAINLDFLADDFLDKIEQLEKDKTYFIYCRSGRRSIRVCTWMRNGGFENKKIFNLDKGFVEWKENFPSLIS